MPTFDLLAARVARALGPLAYGMDSEEGVRGVVASLGWELPVVPPSLIALGQDVAQLNLSLADLNAVRQRANAGEAPESDVDTALGTLTLDLAPVVAAFHLLPGRLRAELPADFIAATHIDREIVNRIFDQLISFDLAKNSPLVYRLLRVAGIIEVTEQVITENTFQPVFELHEIHWKRLLQLLDPQSLARDVYGWGTTQLDTERLFTELLPLSLTLSMPAEHRYASEAFTQRVTPGADVSEPGSQLWVPVFRGDDINFFVVATALPKVRPDELQGLVLALVPSAGGELKIPVSNQLELRLTASAQVGSGASLILRPDRAPDVVLDMEGAADSKLTGGSVAATLTWTAAEWEKPDGATAAGGTQITARSISFGLGAEVANAKADVYGELSIEDGKLIVAPPGDDGLLSSVLPKDGLTAPFSLGVRWSQAGLHFRGSAGLSTTLPLSLSLGPVRLQSFSIQAELDQDKLSAAAGVTASLEIGPVVLTIERIGIGATARVIEGNLGPIDVDVSFKPPTGAGLAINAAVVSGGGFLHFEPAKGEYSGVLELEIAEKISVKGIALLTTKLPGGGKGYSLVIIIFVEGFTPIQLGFGFALIGIGGMLAINRSFDEEALRAGLKSHALDSVMFPADPVRNAPQIISNLNRLFPPASGHHLFGPMVQLAWGTPPLITADIALVLEFGTRRRLLILAQVLSVLPKPDHELVRLQMDAVGVLDFDQSTAALDATLHDSRLLNKFALTGDMAMRLKWDSSPNFAFAVGGLHPAFNPPPNFPKLARISINLSSGDNPRLRCESYFALTSNTVQFGARAELFASAAGFSVHGEIGYDVLIQFDPFAFIADFHAQLQLKRGSTNLFKVELKGSLAGPRPLHIKGKATFSILWWDVSVRIDKVLVGGEKPPLPEPIDVLPRLKEALSNAANWSTKLPVQRPLVQLRADATATTDVLLHPLGTLTIKQGVVPLNTTISRFGQAAPAGANRFQITTVNLGSDNQTLAPVTDFFAPAQFIEMSDDQKLSRPSFESMEAGVAFGSQEIVFSDQSDDWLEVKTIEFETWLIDDDTKVPHRSPAELPKPAQPKVFYQLSHDLLVKQAQFGAAGGSALRRSGSA
ncbi:MAG TPA: DUF6603 domain-containing protein, partial [Pyrinomonadaceae bacterium]|nr:DUF6603 domain-containing protein [Pyrinomonadaceae bacterium]